MISSTLNISSLNIFSPNLSAVLGSNSEFIFSHPWALALAPLLWLITLALRHRSANAEVPRAALYHNASRSLRARSYRPATMFLFLLLTSLLSFIASAPVQIDTIEQEVPRRNVILALDVSRSMGAEDFSASQNTAVSRMEAVRAVVANFITRRTEDRLGLVVFGSQAFLQAPLTRDHGVIGALVSDLAIGMAGDGTAIGDGLALSVKRLTNAPVGSKAIILLTDGANNSGQIDPAVAASLAAKLGITVHTIGIGSEQTRSQLDLFSMQPARPTAEYDEQTLREIATTTGGLFFHADDLQGLEQVYAQIDTLERSSDAETPPQRIVQLYPYLLPPLALTLALALLLFCGPLLRVPR